MEGQGQGGESRSGWWFTPLEVKGRQSFLKFSLVLPSPKPLLVPAVI